MKKVCVIVSLMLVFIIPDSYSQGSKGRKPVSRKAATVKTPGPVAPRITVDTPKGPLYENPPVVVRDTSRSDDVVTLVHDSIKAQIKAPIVQVPITLKTLIIPGVLFAYGAITLNNGGLRIFNEETKELIWNGQNYSSPYFEDYLLLVPAAAVYGLNIAGVKGQNNLIDRSVIYGMSNLIANGIGFGVKYFGIETRPDSSDNHSFPSGHTAEAFVSAEFLHQEYKGRVHWTVVAAGYAVATGVAYMRMYHNKHWLSDVVAGAGIGIASTRFSYYLYPAIKHFLFGSKKVKESAMILPTYSPGGMYGLAVTYKF